SNAGLTDGSTVVVAPGGVEPARVVRLTGSTLARAALTPDTVRVALLGKIVTRGDAVSLLPRDVEPAPGADPIAARQRVSGALGAAWTSELLTVAEVEPSGAVAVSPRTVVGWVGGATTADAPSTPAPDRGHSAGGGAGGPGARRAGAAGYGADSVGGSGAGAAASGSGGAAGTRGAAGTGGVAADGAAGTGGAAGSELGTGAWRGAAGRASADQGAVDAASFGPERAGTAQADAPAAVPIEDLVGNAAAAHRLV